MVLLLIELYDRSVIHLFEFYRQRMRNITSIEINKYLPLISGVDETVPSVGS